MNILVVGSGGREHALAWKLAGEEGVTVTCAPGNAGMADVARLVPTDLGDPRSLLDVAVRSGADLTVVGPELPLERGVVDLFLAEGRPILGPVRRAAQLECSKVFAKEFMSRHGIPTARYRVCADPRAAHKLVASGELGLPIVVKADGLAAGKGVVVAADPAAAHDAIRACMEERQFGEAGARVVLEECLRGPEVSFFALCDGTRAVPLATAQDHKRVFDDDLGPNTGGMGAFAPSPLVDSALTQRIMQEIVDPVLAGFRREGVEYRGFLYAGLMLTCDGPRVIEFNVRFGDPEAQVVVPMIRSALAWDLAAAADGALPSKPLTSSGEKFVGVVLASGGYPGVTTTGRPIAGLEQVTAMSDVLVFHSGTRQEMVGSQAQTVTAGGRVLTVVGRGCSYEEAIARAYDAVSRLSFDGMHFRRDIGARALAAR